MRAGNIEAAKHELLAKEEWSKHPDGRTSQAMLALLEGLRVLKMEGAISRVVAFSAAPPGESGAKREEHMASPLLMATKADPDAVVIALTGNLHGSKKTLPRFGYPFMASFLPASETVSLFVADRGGEAWNCQSDGCGPHKLKSSGGDQRGIVLSETASPLSGYDGVLSTGETASASPPATIIQR
jgi:hypothetical protein